jgi:hypothetical protein
MVLWNYYVVSKILCLNYLGTLVPGDPKLDPWQSRSHHAKHFFKGVSEGA